ncbi:hypothetical protein PM082_005976 [Marasmius tenuissimus]|nr:hypothetical protein PM082_005976 [Marasmius tenuissimus]
MSKIALRNQHNYFGYPASSTMKDQPGTPFGPFLVFINPATSFMRTVLQVERRSRHQTRVNSVSLQDIDAFPKSPSAMKSCRIHAASAQLCDLVSETIGSSN